MAHRSAVSGKKISAKDAKVNPRETIRESKPIDTRRMDWLIENAAAITVYVGDTRHKHLDILKLRKEIDRLMKG